MSTSLNNGWIFIGNTSNIATGRLMYGDAVINNYGKVTLTNALINDDNFKLKSDADSSKQARFDLTALTTSTTRIYALPDVSGTLLVSTDLSGYQPLDSDLTAIAALGSTGFAVRSAANTWVQRQILGTANEVAVSNGTGVAGDVTLRLATNAILSGNYNQLAGGTTSARPVAGTPGRIRYNTDNKEYEWDNGSLWQTIGLSTKLNSGQMLIGNSSNVAARATMYGDGTINNAGKLLIQNILIRDDNFTLRDDTDTTKKARFDTSAIASGNLRIYSLPDKSGTIALLSDLPPGFVLNPGEIYVGDALSDPTSVAMTGDTTITQAGVVSLADNVVTLAKMAHGTAGQLFSFNGVGEPAYVGTGLAGEVLTSAGAGAAPSFVPLGAGVYAPIGASYITQTPDANLTGEQAMSLLGTGLVKSTTATGVQSIAIPHTDYSVDELSNDTGAVNAYVVAINAGVVAYASGLEIFFKTTNPNTGASTINVNGIGLVNIKIQDGSDPIAGDIANGQIAQLKYDGTNFQLLNPIVSGIGDTFVRSGANVFHVGASRQYTTISAALAAFGNATSAADNAEPGTFIVDGGVYDEALTIPQGRLITLLANGTVILGDGLGANWSSTNTRDITFDVEGAYDFPGNGPRPGLSMDVVGGSEPTSTFVGQAASWQVSGKLRIGTGGITHTIVLKHCKFFDGILKDVLAVGLTNLLAFHSFFDDVVDMTVATVFERAVYCEFDGLISVDAYNSFELCDIDAGMTVTVVPPNFMPPVGFFNCDFNGVFTGPASSLLLDSVTDGRFIANGATLAGGATKVYLESYPISNAEFNVGDANGIAQSVAMSADMSLANTGAVTAQPAMITGKPAATVASGDLIMVADINAANALSQVTAQSIADLGAGGTTFLDNVFRVQDNVDVTKQIALEASTITTGTTRTITMPDGDVTLLTNPLAETLADGDVFIGSVGNAAVAQTLSGDVNVINTGAVTSQPAMITNKPAATVAGGDLIMVADINAGNALSQVTALSIANLSTTGPTFDDDVFRVNDDIDVTKQIAFQAATITTGTVRTITMPDADVTLLANPLAESLANTNIFVGSAGGVATAQALSGDATIIADGTMTIADNAITLAKMAGGTDGNLITYDATGDPAFVATGNAGEVLTSNGAGAAPTMQVNLSGNVSKVGTPVDNEIGVWTGDGTLEGDTNFTWDGTQFLLTGSQNLIHTAIVNDDHALEIDCDAAGFGDVKAVDINYTTGNTSAGETEAVILVNVNEAASTGGEVYGMEILATNEGSAEIYGTKYGIQVNPIAHDVGVFSNMDSLLVLAVDQLAALSSGGAGNITFFVADNDSVTVGSAAMFGEMEIVIDTSASGSGVAPTFEYSIGVATWATFSPTDGTNGFRNSGVIAWNSADLAGFAVGTGAEYLVRITRTKNSLTTSPIVDEVQISMPVKYSWLKTGAINVLSSNIAASNAYSVDGTAILSDSAGTMTLSNVDALDATTAATVGAATMTLTNKTFDANGTGNSISNIDVADLANGTDGELITWDAAGVAAVVAAGATTQVLTSNGAGAAPTFQTAASGDATSRSITQAVHGFTIGQVTPVYWNGTIYIGSNASAAATSDVDGLAVASDGNNFVLYLDGSYLTGHNALVADTDYYVGISAGALTATEPGIGNVSKPVYSTVTTTDGYFKNYRGIAVSATGTLTDNFIYVGDATNTAVGVALTGDVTISNTGVSTIAAKAVDVAMLADGTDGELITWDAAGVAAVVAAGTAAQVLTSNGAGAAPTFQAAAGGEDLKRTVTQAAHGFTLNGLLPLYWNGTIYAQSDSSAASTAECNVIGWPTDGNTIEIYADGSYITGFTALTANSNYFVSNAGGMTTTEPSAGEVSKPIFKTISTTDGYVQIYRGIEVLEGESGNVVFTQSFSGDATCDITNLPTNYDYFDIELIDVVPATVGVNFQGYTSTDGGTTFDVGAADYAWMVEGQWVSGGGLTTMNALDQGDSSDALIKFNGSRSISNVAGRGVNGTIRLSNPAGTDLTNISSNIAFAGTSAGEMSKANGSAQRLSSADVDAFRVSFSAGNLASGQVIVRGYNTTSGVDGNSSSPVKSWAFFSGVTSITINDSLNVSGIVRNGLGDYTVTFATALTSADYAISFDCGQGTSGQGVIGFSNDTVTARTTTGFRFITANFVTNVNEDSAYISFSVVA